MKSPFSTNNKHTAEWTKNMELRTLKYFLAVAREANITKAAALLHVTQPTLSRQLMQLEEELGVKLFERGSHSITLTDDGLLLKRRAGEIISLAEKTAEELSGSDELHGMLDIASGEFKSFSLFSDILCAFKDKNPGVNCRLYSANGDNIKDRLDRGLADIGLLSDPVDISRYEFLRLPQREIWGAVVHMDSGLYDKEFITPSDLCSVPLIMPQRLMVQNELKAWFGDFYDKLEISMIYDLLYNAAVIAGKKMGVVLSIELDSKFDHLKFIPLYPKLEFGSVMVWKKNQIHSAVTDGFIGFAKEYIKGIS